jgi:DNA-binding response OmpR family regulator
VPIVFLTAADADGHLALRGYAAGAVDYLTKPIDPWVLRAKVTVLVELWEKTRKVRDQAALTATYERRLTHAAARVDQALRLADGTNHELKVLLEQLAEDLS